MTNNSNKNLDFFNTVTSNYLNILKEHFSRLNNEVLLLEKGNKVAIDTLVVNFGFKSAPMVISFTFIPIHSEDLGMDTVFLQLYSVLPSSPEAHTMSEIEKSINFINNQLPIGHLSISNANEIVLRSVQAISTNNYDLDPNVFVKVTDLFQMIISVFNPDIDAICKGDKSFKQLAFELSNLS